MKPERLKTFTNYIGLFIIVINIISPIISISLFYGSWANKDIVAIGHLIVHTLLIISGIGILKNKAWSINLCFVSSILVAILYLFSYPLYLIVASIISTFTFFPVLGEFALPNLFFPFLMLIPVVYIFIKRKIIYTLFNNNDSTKQAKSWSLNKGMFLFIVIIINLITWFPFLAYLIYGFTKGAFQEIGILGASIMVNVSILASIIINIVLLQTYFERNKKALYTTLFVSIILALLYIIPIANQYLTTGRLY